MKLIVSAFIFAVLCVTASRGKKHMTCERKYDNIGCFRNENAKHERELLNDRHKIDWNNIEEYMHGLACRCDEIAREKNKDRKSSELFVGFALHYFGVCYGRTAAHMASFEGDIHQEHLCVGNQSYSICAHGEHKECTGRANAEYIYKFKTKAPNNVNGGYAEWGAWTKCQSECGPGLRIRERTCTNPEPQGEGKDCSGLGEPTETAACISKPCPVDGGFSEWKSWGECSKSCSGGMRTRSRTCTNPAPDHGGRGCEGDTTSSEPCNIAPCPVHGGWSSWSGHDECTVKCGGGTQKRTRGCNNPPPMYGGNDCEGEAIDSRACKTEPCPVDGGYTKWSSYGACSKSCGGGRQYRSRTCTKPRPAHGGKNCQGYGPATESRPCNQDACPIKQYSKQCCEGGSLYLSCEGRDRISIRQALYGRRTRNICKHWMSWAMRTNCQSGNSYHKVSSACNGKKACEVHAKNRVFGDPCWGTTKYLQVTYRCQ